MAEMPDKSVDCIICDLPYGTTNNKWDVVIPFDLLWAQYKRLLKPRGAVCLFAQMPFAAQVVASNYPDFKYEWIWEKNSATGHLNANCAPLKKHENILVFSEYAAAPCGDDTKRMIYNPQFKRGKAYVTKHGSAQSDNYRNQSQTKTENDGTTYRPTDILTFPHESRGRFVFHPTQKPVDLVRYLIRTYTDEGMVVLDNCMGSGTTAVACIREKRHFVGFELNGEYYKKASERIAVEMMSPTLF